MRQMLVSFLCGCLLTAALQAQESISFVVREDGSATMTVTQEGQETPDTYSLSPKAVTFLVPLTLEEYFKAESQGKFSISRFQGEEKEVAAYQSALEMTTEQVTRLAKQRAEFEKNSVTAHSSFLRKLTQFDHLSEEEVTRLDQDARRIMRGEVDSGQALLRDILTEEQFTRLQEMELALPSQDGENLPFVNLEAYRSLELSEEQQKKLDSVQKEFEAETRNWTQSFTKFLNDGKEFSPEKIEALNTLVEKSEQLKARMKARVLAFLTPEQTAKYEKLLAEWPPKFKKLQEDWLARQKEKGPEDDAWKKSWKPGDPVPEGAVPPLIKNRVFPFGG